MAEPETRRDPAELFAEAAPYYARYRPRYPEVLFTTLVNRLGLDGTQLAADVGCGTGQLTVPLAEHVRTVIAIDPQPQMLAQAPRVPNVRWRLGDSTRLAELGIEGADLAVFAASFHWMDRAAVLRELDALLAPGGAVVLAGIGVDDADDPDWARAITAVRQRHLGPVRLAGSGAYRRPEGSHEEILAASPFPVVERWSWPSERTLTVEEVVGLQFSYSFSTPALFGDGGAAFADDVRAAVLRLYPGGTVVEPLVTELLVAHRD